MQHRKILHIIIAVIFILSISCSLSGQAKSKVVKNKDSQNVNASAGAVLQLDDGASLQIPPASLPTNQQVSIQILEEKVKDTEPADEFSPVGSLYEISFGGTTLKTSAELTLPYDPAQLPDDVTADMLFIAYYDDETGKWVYAGGEVDQAGQVVRIQTTHASRWTVSTWNWDALLAILSKLLQASWVDLIEAVDLITNDCPQEGTVFRVQNVNLQNVIQGCVEKEDGLTAQGRVVNPKSFYYEITGSYEGQAPAFTQMLSPGEGYEFEINQQNPSPFTVKAEITQKAGYRLVIHQILMMLPGFTTIENQPRAVACLTERLHDVSYFASAAESLAEMDDLSGVAAGESLVEFLQDPDAVRRFLTAADDCVPGLAKTWSRVKISRIANLANVIISSTDYIANTLAMMFRGETEAQVNFRWDQTALDQMALDQNDPQSVVNWVNYMLKTGNSELFRDLLVDDDLYYAYYLEGGQGINRDVYIKDLQNRIQQPPVCQGIYYESNHLYIWYNSWNPAWQMSEMCYGEGGCQQLSPPWESDVAAFMFLYNNETGKYQFKGMYQNTPDFFEPLKSCNSDQPLLTPTPIANCPFSPPQRLKVGEPGRVCTKSDPVILRASPGKGQPSIKSLATGTTFTVIGGPECAGNGWSWWQVKLNDGKTGWLAEGGDFYDPYFLCPGN